MIVGGGLGVRLGEPYAQRIAAAMLPHLFADSRPPKVEVAELGDLGGAIGASLLVEAGARRDARRPTTVTSTQHQRQRREQRDGHARGGVEQAAAAALAHQMARARQAPDEEQADREQQPVDHLHADEQRDHRHARDHRHDGADRDHRGDQPTNTGASSRRRPMPFS